MEQEIEELKRLFYSDRLTQYEKRKLIEYYEKQIKELEKENTRLKKLVPAGFYPDINTDYLKNLKRSNNGTRYRKSI